MLGAICNKADQFIEPGKGKTNTVIANKEYIVSAGAVHTPQILQLSGLSPLDTCNYMYQRPWLTLFLGIGQKSLLKSLGIPVAVDLPGV